MSVITKCWGSYDIASVWLVLDNSAFLEDPGVYWRPGDYSGPGV